MPRRRIATRSRKASPADDRALAVREVSWSYLDDMAGRIAARVRRTFDAEAVVGVVKGGVFVGAAIAEALGRPFYAVRISRRSRDHGLLPSPKVYGAVPAALSAKRVLIVDDVAASGETLKLARRLARKAGARDVRTATVAVRSNGFRPDWFAMVTDDLVVFPWDLPALDEDRRFDPVL